MELAKLAALVAANAGCPASIFAHADPVGSDDVNKTISDRRAIAIYAALTRQPDKWEELYSNAVDGDTWGTPALQAMLATLKDASGISYYSGAIDGEYGPNTKDATKRFQGDAGLAADGQAGPTTRKVLFGAYMDAVCSDPSGTRFTMKPEDFLGGGADPGGKMAMQGCSRFNPVVLLPSSHPRSGRQPEGHPAESLAVAADAADHLANTPRDHSIHRLSTGRRRRDSAHSASHGRSRLDRSRVRDQGLHGTASHRDELAQQLRLSDGTARSDRHFLAGGVGPLPHLLPCSAWPEHAIRILHEWRVSLWLGLPLFRPLPLSDLRG